MSEVGSHVTLSFWIGTLSLISVCAGLGLTYAAFFSDRGFRFGMKTISVVVTCFCVGAALLKNFGEANVLLSLLFLAITIPIANFLAVLCLWAVIWYRKQTGRLWGKQKIEPYVGPVTQKPVDVPQKRLEHRKWKRGRS